MKTTGEYVLWLPSWYPNKYEPYNGDFIQRHAQATALYTRVVVCAFPQMGEAISVDKSFADVQESINLIEIVDYTKFTPSGIKLLDKIRYNIIYYRTARRCIINLFKKYGVPCLVHVHVPIKAGNIARWIKRKYKIDYIVSEHSALYLEGASDSFSNRSRIYQHQVCQVFKKAMVATNVSAAIAKFLTEKFDLSQIKIIHNTVDTNLFYYKPHQNTVFYFIHVSSLSEQKNIEGILRTFATYKKIRQDWKLKLIGPATAELAAQIRGLGLDKHIELVGEIAYTAVAEQMNTADAFVLFSRYENFPCVVVEALCCGLPVIASNVGGINEAVDETNGILVETANEKQLLNALVKVQKEYSLFNRKAISEAAIKNYSYEVIGQQFFNLYHNNSGL